MVPPADQLDTQTLPKAPLWGQEQDPRSAPAGSSPCPAAELGLCSTERANRLPKPGELPRAQPAARPSPFGAGNRHPEHRERFSARETNGEQSPAASLCLRLESPAGPETSATASSGQRGELRLLAGQRAGPGE